MRIRTYGSWVKNFGFTNANYVLGHVRRVNKYSDITPKNEKAVNELAATLRAEYELKLEEGATFNDRIYEYTALELIRKGVEELPELIYFDELASDGSKRYKPDFAPETFETFDYIGKNVLVKKGPLTKEDFFHVSRILVENTSACPVPTKDELDAISSETGKIDEKPLVSILIPNKDNIDVLKTCYESVLKSTYDNYEIVIVENNSTDPKTFEYYKTMEHARVETIITDWNFSHIMNEGLKFCKGEYVILLNNDTEVIASDWIEQMLHFATKKEVGIVGAKLMFMDDTIQHAGVTFGIRGVAGHAFYGAGANELGYENRICLPQNLSVVTAACLMVRRSIFDAVQGFDENLKVNYNDVDFCIKVREAGYRVVYTPFAKLYHYESKTRGFDNIDEKKLAQQIKESRYFQRKWCKRIWEGDPYYNRNLSLEHDDFREKE